VNFNPKLCNLWTSGNEAAPVFRAWPLRTPREKCLLSNNGFLKDLIRSRIFLKVVLLKRVQANDKATQFDKFEPMWSKVDNYYEELICLVYFLDTLYLLLALPSYSSQIRMWAFCCRNIIIIINYYNNLIKKCTLSKLTFRSKRFVWQDFLLTGPNILKYCLRIYLIICKKKSNFRSISSCQYSKL